MQAGICSVAEWSRSRYDEGVSPTTSVKRVLKEPREVHPTCMQASVTETDARSRCMALDTAGEQIGMRGLAIGPLELPGKMSRRHGSTLGQRRHIQWFRIVPVHQVPGPAQVRQGFQRFGIHRLAPVPGSQDKECTQHR